MALFFSASLLIPAVAFPNDPTLQNNYAVELLQKGEFEKGLSYFQDAYRLYSSDPTVKSNLAFAYVMVGEKLMQLNRFEEAADKFDRAKDLYPDEPKYWLLRGIAFYRMKDYFNARYEMEQARARGGDSVEVLFHLGRLFYDMGETLRGVDLWEQALKLEPGNTELQALLEKARREVAVEGRMDQGHSGKFQLSFDAAVKTDLADRILGALEDFYNQVGNDLGRYPSAKVPVILYAKKDFKEITDSPSWSGGVYDGKIRLPIGGVQELTPRLRAILRHEYTHVVVYDITRGNCPVWLNEGLSVTEEKVELETPLVELDRAVRGGKLLSFKSLEGSFNGFGSSQAFLAYEQSWSMTRFLVQNYGWHKVQEILVNLGRKMTIEEAIAKALGDYGLDYAAVEAEWLKSVRKEFAE
ncbi:MAG: tetratricopeptide repeat protein [Geobacter sp.]|nr:tetratricopeptide repeat protein [Geobacter sp.]